MNIKEKQIHPLGCIACRNETRRATGQECLTEQADLASHLTLFHLLAVHKFF